jgi:NADH-quinone oxidoreductase subunit L
MFHLYTHAFFKALLFLGAGSVMHAMGHVVDMRRFGGLRHRMPLTHWTFLVGCLALAGIVPFAGFWSKDAILLSVSEKSQQLQHELEVRAEPKHADAGTPAEMPRGVVFQPAKHFLTDIGRRQANPTQHIGRPAAYPTANHTRVSSGLTDGQLKSYSSIYRWLFHSAILTAFLTAFYTFRAFFMTFYGKEVIPHEAGDHAHESPASMTGPLVVLAVCALVVGMYFELSHTFADFLKQTPSLAVGAGRLEVYPTANSFRAGSAVARTAHRHADQEAHLRIAATSTIVALAGILVAAYFYLGDRREVDWLKYVLDFQWLSRLHDVESVARLRQLPWVVTVNRFARAVKLGWLAALVGQLLLLVALVLSAPLLLGLYLTPYRLSANKFYVDEIYDVCVVQPLRFVAWISYAADRWIIDGLVDLCGRIPPLIGYIVRSLQTGLTPFYAVGMIAGIAVVVAVQENSVPILLSIVLVLLVAKMVRPEG